MCGGTRGQAHLTVKIKRLFFFFFFLRFKVNNESQEILRQDTSKGAILHGPKPKQPCKVGRVTYTVRQERTIPIHAMCNHRLHRITPGKFTRCCFSFQENHSLLPSRSRFLEHTMLARGGARRFSRHWILTDACVTDQSWHPLLRFVHHCSHGYFPHKGKTLSLPMHLYIPRFWHITRPRSSSAQERSISELLRTISRVTLCPY